MPRFIQDPVTLKLVPANEYHRQQNGHAVHGEIEPFVSHVDGTLVDSRKKLREHNIRHGVVSAADLGNEGDEVRKKREDFYAGRPYDTERRRASVIFAVDVESRTDLTRGEKRQMIDNFQRMNR